MWKSYLGPQIREHMWYIPPLSESMSPWGGRWCSSSFSPPQLTTTNASLACHGKAGQAPTCTGWLLSRVLITSVSLPLSWSSTASPFLSFLPLALTVSDSASTTSPKKLDEQITSPKRKIDISREGSTFRSGGSHLYHHLWGWEDRGGEGINRTQRQRIQRTNW